MPQLYNTHARQELRRDRRYSLPILEVTIAGQRFWAINWSLQGALLEGICEVIGVRVRGAMGMAGSRDAVPFAATVIRTDTHTGNCAICFEDFRTETIDFPEPAQVEELFFLH